MHGAAAPVVMMETVRNDLMTQFVQMGARYVSTGTDLPFPIAACARKAKFAREIKVCDWPVDRCPSRPGLTRCASGLAAPVEQTVPISPALRAPSPRSAEEVYAAGYAAALPAAARSFSSSARLRGTPQR
jgi:hypothetical protein